MFHQRLCSEDALGGNAGCYSQRGENRRPGPCVRCRHCAACMGRRRMYYQRLCDEAAGGHAGCDSQCGNGAAAGYAGQGSAVGLQLDSMGGGGLHAAT